MTKPANEKQVQEKINKLHKAKWRIDDIFVPFEYGTWLLGAVFAMFIAGAAGYGVPLAEYPWVDVLRAAGIALAPGAVLTTCHKGAKAIIDRRIAKQYRLPFMRDDIKIKYVTTHFKDGVDKILALSQTQNKAKIKSVVRDIERIEKKAKLTPTEEAVLEENAKKILKELSRADQMKLSRFFSGTSR